MTAAQLKLQHQQPTRVDSPRLRAAKAWRLLPVAKPAGTIVDEAMRDARAPRTASMVTTPAGITIGAAYIPPPTPMGHEAERIQALLSRAPDRTGPTFWQRLAAGLADLTAPRTPAQALQGPILAARPRHLRHPLHQAAAAVCAWL